MITLRQRAKPIYHLQGAHPQTKGEAMAPPRILIIDDEPTLIFFMEQSLAEDQEYLVDTAKSGEEALAKLGTQGYDLIIVDFRLPDINGLRVIETATQLQPGTLAILMTAYGSQEVEKEAQRLEVWRYVVKPFSMEEMKAMVREALDARIPGRRLALASAQPNGWTT